MSHVGVSSDAQATFQRAVTMSGLHVTPRWFTRIDTAAFGISYTSAPLSGLTSGIASQASLFATQDRNRQFDRMYSFVALVAEDL